MFRAYGLLSSRLFLLILSITTVGHVFTRALPQSNDSHEFNDANDRRDITANTTILPAGTSPNPIGTPTSTTSTIPLVQPTIKPTMIAGGNLTFIKDSGVCETTPDIRQISGYINISKDAHLWFWFFAARTNAGGAPLTIWVNGRPGCSSMAGLFQGHGPCKVDSSGSKTVTNPYSWNNVSNMVYIDLPVGAGFSYGSEVKDTFQGTAEQLWTALQMLFYKEEFAEFRTRRLIFATEGFGARLAPRVVQFSNSQNERIDRHEIAGYKVVFSSIMINNGLHDPLTQMDSFIKFCTRAPGYGRIQNGTIVNRIKGAMAAVGGCGVSLQECAQSGSAPTGNLLCSTAWLTCESSVLQAAIGYRSATDLMRLQTDSAYPPDDYIKYLQNGNVMAKIGALTAFNRCNDGVKNAFTLSGDLGRSSLPDLAELANSKFPILVWAGDLDISDNWLGVYHSMITMNWFGSQMLNSTWTRNITVSNQIVARAKVVNNLSFARIYGAGHAVAAYQPWVALQIFQEFSQKDTLFYMLDQHEHHYHQPRPHRFKNKGERKWNHGRWFTAVSVVGAVVVAVL